MLHEEGLDNVFKRHEKHALATRAAVQAWGFENVCKEEKDFSNVLTSRTSLTMPINLRFVFPSAIGHVPLQYVTIDTNEKIIFCF